MSWITNFNTIIFSPNYNELLNTELLSNYKNIIFSPYNLNNDFFEKCTNCDNIYQSNVFNQQVDNLPNSIISITFGYWFNQPVDNLPNGIINLTFEGEYIISINKLPNNLKQVIYFSDCFDKITFEKNNVKLINKNNKL